MNVLTLLMLVFIFVLVIPGAQEVNAKGKAKAAFYVSPSGNDSWSGRLAAPNKAKKDGPFATIARAQQAVRIEKSTPSSQPVLVLIRGGMYRLSEPITLTPEDSGSESAPVTYAAYPGEKPVFTGGRVIKGWKKAGGELWTAEIPEVKNGEWYFHQLFVNGARRTRARTPNEGYYHIAGTIDPLTDRAKAHEDPNSKIGFRFNEGEMRRWQNLEDVNIVLYHSWTASVHWIQDLNDQNRIVRFTAPCGWPVGYWEGSQRYHIENCLEALDSPGEWYLDRKTGVLTYWPMPGEDMVTIEVVAPRLQHLVEIKGDAQLGLPVEHVALRGLSFQHADWKHDRTQSADGQAAVHLSAAVVATGARSCVIEDCEIGHVGEYALILGEGCKHNRVNHCHLHDLGGGGVRIGETELHREPERQTDHNVVDNCFIHDGGHVFLAGIGVWIGRSSFNTISHNEICDFFYSGCSVGWNWGYAPSEANHNIFEFNHIHNLGKGVLSDMGGIYSLGISPGTIERNNVIHDVYSYSYGGWGLYTDEGSTDIVLENNVVYDTKSGGFHQHYGRENIVRNNIFAFAREANIIRSREEEHSSFTFERNLVLTNHGEPLGGNWGNDHYTMASNLYWDTESKDDLEFSGLSFEEWQSKGRDKDSVIADPLFRDVVKNDFRLKDGSPAFKLGFQNIDNSKVGLYGEPDWVNAPKKIVRTPIDLPPLPRPGPIVEDFETTPVGQLAQLANTSGEENGASIRVTDEVAAGGQHCLKFTDAPGLSHEWQPHLFYRTNFRRGNMRLSYDVRLEPGAVFWNELRDAASPYRVGPSLRIEKNGDLKAGDRVLLNVPRSQWVYLEFNFTLGKDSPGSYDLKVTLPDQPPQEFEKLPFGTPEFRRLEWLGFISLATETAVFYIDNLRLERA